MLPKKEAMSIDKEIEKLEKHMGGIKDMDRLPGAIYIVDPKKEYIAVNEAKKAGHSDRRHRRHELRSR